MTHEFFEDKIWVKAGKEVSLRIYFIDSLQIKTTRRGGISRGVDGGKK
ncbi:MAG: hypothetical protein IPO21_01835 [Bacteroidales bacterium]|nr:hypothetical protein [Bacteroidales bacterium]